MKNKKTVALVIGIIIISAFLITTNINIVISGSMEPEIKVGSLAFITKDKENIKNDDVISYNFGKTKVLHRVIKVKKEGFITKGDNNNTKDFGVINKKQVNGKYLFSIPFLGYVVLFIRKYIFLIAFLVITLYLLKSEVRKLE